jgi:hypothetical protein
MLPTAKADEAVVTASAISGLRNPAAATISLFRTQATRSASGPPRTASADPSAPPVST